MCACNEGPLKRDCATGGTQYDAVPRPGVTPFSYPRIGAPRLLTASSVNKSGPEHVLYVVQAGPNSYTQRSYGPTLFSTLGPGLRASWEPSSRVSTCSRQLCA